MTTPNGTEEKIMEDIERQIEIIAEEAMREAGDVIPPQYREAWRDRFRKIARIQLADACGERS